ncbi:MAG TPA: class I SAM-dependent methyltransferase [Anaerolineales bacterium]|nr:class I SAM-dependent methyltransferase [Anaerolineales bacterium]
MDPHEYELMFAAEDRHWWYRGMECLIRAILDHRYGRDGRLRILDAGCGTGRAMTSYLASYGRVTGVDVSEIALGYCRRRNAGDLVRANVTGLPFPSGSFDLVASFDVLYERDVANDAQAVEEFARLIVPGGRLLLRLPAYDWLRGQHDCPIHTARRYTAGQVARLIERCGLTVELLSYANTFLFPFALLKRMQERIRPISAPKSDLETDFGLLDGVLRSILCLEAPFITHAGLPFGLSVLAVGRKI